MARTVWSSRGAPVAAACERTMAACRVVRSASPIGVSTRAPNPVFTPYTGAPPLSACTTTERLTRSEEHTSELQSRENLVCHLLLEKKKKIIFSFSLLSEKKENTSTFAPKQHI